MKENESAEDGKGQSVKQSRSQNQGLWCGKAGARGGPAADGRVRCTYQSCAGELVGWSLTVMGQRVRKWRQELSEQ